MLAYDEQQLDDSLISRDIKTVFDSRANTAHLYVVAPFLPLDTVVTALAEGVALQRASPYTSSVGGEFCAVGIGELDGMRRVVAIRLSWINGTLKRADPVAVAEELRHGWLFDLFHRYEGLVQAPAGVHFRKTSGKHSPRFLRTANVLASSAACGLLALFCLEQISVLQPRRVLVDTAPLVSVAFAMLRIARVLGLWHEDPPVKSFSSYGGLRSIGRLSASDIVLVSASTSNGLAVELQAAGAGSEAMATLYYLASQDDAKRPAQIVCDLGSAPQRTFGYSTIPSYPGTACPLCKGGSLPVDLEGDQFLLQRREHLRMEILKISQAPDARAALELIARRSLIHVSMRSSSLAPTSLVVQDDIVLEIPQLREKLVRHLRRFCPKPLNVVVRLGISAGALSKLFNEAGLSAMLTGAESIEASQLAQATPADGGGALVVFGCLQDHALVRAVSASLRSVVPHGLVTYLGALTIADSSEHLGDLRRFIQFGENGPDTFTFRDCMTLAYPLRDGAPTAWDAESRLLNDLCGDDNPSAELTRRKEWLDNNEAACADLFWPGQSGPLAIQNDFVFLGTQQDKDKISQGDVFAVISNAYAAARCYNRPLNAKAAEPGQPVRLSQSVYGHVLFCPSNFRRYNDAVLRAAFLRAAAPSELLYEVDEACSEEVKVIILSELEAWAHGRGDSLPEFLLALATRRLRLDAHHTSQVRAALSKATLPPYMQRLVERIYMIVRDSTASQLHECASAQNLGYC